VLGYPPIASTETKKTIELRPQFPLNWGLCLGRPPWVFDGDQQTRREIWILALGTIVVEAPFIAIAAVMMLD
jgi:hypothetical protein